MSTQVDVEPPALIDIKEVARLLDISESTVRRLAKGGQMPPALTVGLASKRWRSEEIEGWVDAGCPPASEWSYP